MNATKRKALKTVSGAAIAAAAAGLFLTANIGTAFAGESHGVHCAGANACKGQSECKSAKNSCKGQNSCKGTGWVSAADEKACKEKGGKVAK